MKSNPAKTLRIQTSTGVDRSIPVEERSGNSVGLVGLPPIEEGAGGGAFEKRGAGAGVMEPKPPPLSDPENESSPNPCADVLESAPTGAEGALLLLIEPEKVLNVKLEGISNPRLAERAISEAFALLGLGFPSSAAPKSELVSSKLRPLKIPDELLGRDEKDINDWSEKADLPNDDNPSDLEEIDAGGVVKSSQKDIKDMLLKPAVISLSTAAAWLVVFACWDEVAEAEDGNML